ncbi:MAG: AraC family transcriptional regulator [Parvularculaceae bacterium]|nr:AraC family transcriptional regulator [Parvularculaceae bacterium]
MQFRYFQPDPDVQEEVSSYYDLELSYDVEDLMRAEIANIRFVLSGCIHSDLTGEMTAYPAGSAILCGPSFRSSRIGFDANTRVFGAAVTPVGWVRMFGPTASNFANAVERLADHVPAETSQLIEQVFDAETDDALLAAANKLFSSMSDEAAPMNRAFLDRATEWLVDPEPTEIGDLLDNVELSHRQVERLCKGYFGASPKKLHRKFRALHSANRLTWQELDDWRDVATTAYYDQAHFIREFKEFNGRTPSEFIGGPHILVRVTLQERRRINHHSPFSLIG